MRERPILFSAPMVRAILDGTKTQTRRVLKMRHDWTVEEREDGSRWPWYPDYVTGGEWDGWAPCPYGVRGDRLWVRETWQYADWTDEGEPYIRYASDGRVRFCPDVPDGEVLVDVWEELSRSENYAIDNKAADRKWRPSIFMPRWASRLTLTITDVRVERLHDVSWKDALAEGVRSWEETLSDDPSCIVNMHDPRHAYAQLWELINGQGSWASNPWVWVVSFTRTAEGA